jgi:hypothetical protein
MWLSPHNPSTPRLNAASYLHYHKIVENEFYVSTIHQGTGTIYSQQPQGYPDEWFPSVSATIGDRYPERSVFMLFIALTSGKTPDGGIDWHN